MKHYDHLYAELVNGLIGALLQELLIIGVFFVLYGYMRLLVRRPKLLKSPEFHKRAILLGSVTLFVFYVSLTYFMEYVNLDLDRVVEEIHTYDDYEMARSKVTLLVMVPIDLLSIILLGSMYATLGLESLGEDDAIDPKSIQQVLGNLFLITGGWHLVTVIWWLVFGLTSRHSIDGQDVLYHGAFALMHFLGFWSNRRWESLRDKTWYGVIMYAMLLIAVYVSRIWMYIDRL